MSEILGLPPEPFDVLAQAEHDALGRGSQERRYHELLGEEVDERVAADMAK